MGKWIRWLKVDQRVRIRILRKIYWPSSSMTKIKTQGKQTHIYLSLIVKIQTMEYQFKCNQTCMELIRQETIWISIIRRPVRLILRVNSSLDLIKKVNPWVIIMCRLISDSSSNKETSEDNTVTTNLSVQYQTLLSIINNHLKIHKIFFKDLIIEE